MRPTPSKSVSTTRKVKAEPSDTPKVKAGNSISSAARGSKRKALHEQVFEVAAEKRAQRLKKSTIKEKEKTTHSRYKYELKSKLELAKLEHEQRQAEAERVHQMAMLDRQIELEHLCRGDQPAPVFGGVAGGPAYGAPPPGVYDPSFLRM